MSVDSFRPLLLGFAVLCLLSAVGIAVFKRSGAASATHATGQVVALEEDREGGAAPVVEFTPAEGSTVRFRGSVFTTPSAFAVGESVTVLYDPHRPEAASIDSVTEQWFCPAMAGFFGGVALLVALGGKRREAAGK